MLFNEASFDSKIFGDLQMTFKKDASHLIWYCEVVIKNENRIEEYLYV